MKTYTGGCHCGAVHYEVVIENLTEAMECNCSICSKRAWLLTFAPASAFRLINGAENLTDYQFNTHRIHHLFCSTCGVASFGRGTGPDGIEMISINVRCLDEVDLDAIKVNHFDGKNR